VFVNIDNDFGICSKVNVEFDDTVQVPSDLFAVISRCVRFLLATYEVGL
jgi:hypothetical protein